MSEAVDTTTLCLFDVDGTLTAARQVSRPTIGPTVLLRIDPTVLLPIGPTVLLPIDPTVLLPIVPTVLLPIGPTVLLPTGPLLQSTNLTNRLVKEPNVNVSSHLPAFVQYKLVFFTKRLE